MTLPTIQVASADSGQIDCNKSNKSESEKNYCLVKQREIDNKGYSWDSLGRDSLETLTVMISAMAAITVQVSSKPETNNKCPVYIGRSLEPVLVAAGGLLLIFAEIHSYFDFKDDCSDLLDAKGSDLAGKINNINNAAGPDATLSGSCTSENLKVEGQICDYCRAKACTLRMKKSAADKVKHLDWVKSAYMTAGTIELANIVINLAKGVMCSLVYTSATVCANIQASDCYKYSVDEDATVRSFLVQGPKRKSLNDELELHLVNSLNFNLHQEKYNKALLSQITHSANYVETLLLMDDFRRLADGAVVSTSVDQYNFMNSININALDKTNQLQGVMKVALELSNQLSPLQKAQAKYDVNEILSSLGMVAGVSLVLMNSTRQAISKIIKKAWAYPLGRVVYFGALYGLVYANQEVYKDRIVKELDKRSQSFDDKIAELTIPVIDPGPGIPTDFAINLPLPPVLPTMKAPKPLKPTDCITEDLARDKTCECLKANKCNQMKIPEVTLPDGESLPPSVVSTIKNIKDTTNAYSRGDHDKLYLNGKSLAAGMGSLNADYNRLKNKLKEDQVKANQTPHEIDKEIKKMQSLLLQSVAEAMGVPAPASTSTTAGGAGDASKKTAEKNESTQAALSPGQTGVSTATKGGNTLDLNLNEPPTDTGLTDTTDKAELTGFKFQTDEISKRPEENIFKKISSRYLRSAYPALLREIPAKSGKEK